jgi:hypothetical protein
MRKIISVYFVMALLLISIAGAQVIQNDTFWKDTDGNPILSQGGGAIKVGDTWYWYGAKYGNAATYYNQITKSNYSGGGGTKVSCYSSKDLTTWRNEGDVFNAPGGWFGRLGVVYHAKTSKYVLVAQSGSNLVLFAHSSSPKGPFIHSSTDVPPGVVNGGTGDQTVFQDDDGKAYIVCSSKSGRSNWYIIPLRESDYLGMEPSVRIGGGVGREGNCMFKYRGRYYFVSSLLYGWNSSPAYYISATNILGPYGAEKTMTNSEIDYCHVTQTGFFITVNGTLDTTVVFCGDRWSNSAGNGLGFNQWCPVTFNGTDAVFNSHSRWTLDAVKGTWKVATGNNYILNPAFEADRISTSPLRGWAGSRNVAGSPVAGNFSLSLNSGSTATHSVPSLPNGTYELSAWIQSSGSGGSCDISVSDFGGTDMKHAATEQMTGWTQVRIPGIRITTGKAVVKAANSGKSSCKMDDFSLVSGDAVSISAFPRPVKREFVFDPATYSVTASASGEAVRLEMYTVNGKTLLKQILVPGSEAAQFTLPVHRFEKGQYLLRMISGGNSSTRKVTIAR